MMARIIKNGGLVEDGWRIVDLPEGETPATAALPEGDLLFPVTIWQARKDEILARRRRIGLLVRSGDEIESIADNLFQFTVIAVEFPKFVDGRGYSTARLLRERYGYTGELRAVGDVLYDQLFLMRRVGFNAFALRADKDEAYIKNALAHAFDTFSESYQGAVDEPRPYFRRRTA